MPTDVPGIRLHAIISRSRELGAEVKRAESGYQGPYLLIVPPSSQFRVSMPSTFDPLIFPDPMDACTGSIHRVGSSMNVFLIPLGVTLAYERTGKSSF
jgi:hypothetical protein